MADITLKGNPIHTIGNLPEKGRMAPDFKLTTTDLSDISLKNYAGKRIVLNIFPSLDTGICAASVRAFNARAGNLNNTVVICVSLDTPFAHKRFCTTEGLRDVVSASELRDRNFGRDYGVRIGDGPMAGLFSRAVVIIDTNGRIIYTEQIPEIVQEPNYEAALSMLG